MIYLKFVRSRERRAQRTTCHRILEAEGTLTRGRPSSVRLIELLAAARRGRVIVLAAALTVAAGLLLLDPPDLFRLPPAGLNPSAPAPGHGAGLASPARHQEEAFSLADDHACRFWGLITPTAQDALIQDHLLSGTYDFQRLGTANPDGWGIAFYTPFLQAAGHGEPIVMRARPRPNDAHDTRFSDAIGRMMDLDAERAIAHVRLASTGAIQVPDPHPLLRDGIVFAHNGTIDTTTLATLIEQCDADFLIDHPLDYLNRRLDTELYFLYMLCLREQGVETGESGLSHRFSDAMAEAGRRVLEADAIRTAANAIAIHGDTLFAMRFDPNDRKVYKLRYKACGGGWEVASEPVGSDTSGWSAIPAKSVGIFRCNASPVFVSASPPPMPYLELGAVVIDDDGAGGSAGNGDGGADAGERIELLVAVRNDGAEPAGNVQATLSSEDTYVSILDGSESYGDLLPGQEIECPDDFDIQISPACPPGHALDLIFTLACEGRPSWVRHVSLPVQAPVVELAGWTLDDDAGGDGNGRLAPGETAALTVRLRNDGDEDASGLALTLSIDHPQVQALSDEAALVALLPGNELPASPPFTLHADGDCPNPDLLFCEILVTGDYGYERTLALQIPVGGFWDDMEADLAGWTTYPIGQDWTNQWHRSSSRNATPGGSWSRKFGDAGDGDYADNADGVLQMPAQTLRPISYLAFRHWMEAELRPGGQTYCYDGGRVEMSVDGGPWEPIAPVGGYPCRSYLSSPPGPWFDGTPLYSGTIDWEPALFRIAGETGQARFRFRFGSNSENGLEGWYIDDVEFYGYDPGTVAIHDDPRGASAETIWRAEPNPFHERTVFSYRLSTAADISLCLYDAQGRRIRTLASGRLPQGEHRWAWDGLDESGAACGAGLYFARLASPQGERLLRVVRIH